MNIRHPEKLEKLTYAQVNGMDWQCCLAGSSKMAPMILIFSIAIAADYSFKLNSTETYAPKFFGHNNLFLSNVFCYY